MEKLSDKLSKVVQNITSPNGAGDGGFWNVEKDVVYQNKRGENNEC